MGADKVSGLVRYSIGIVAVDKDLDSLEIECTPIEKMPMVDGDINDGLTTDTLDGIESPDGSQYSLDANSTNTVRATWLPSGSNRKTAPDVRVGERVMLYRYKDADKYYWSTEFDDRHLRRLETVKYGYDGSGVDKDGKDSSGEYEIEISTHSGNIQITTGQGNGEYTSYNIRINTKEGRITITDGVDNSFLFDSANNRIRMNNGNGSSVDIDKDDITITAVSDINLIAKNNIRLTSENILSTSTSDVSRNQVHSVETTHYSSTADQSDVKSTVLNVVTNHSNAESDTYNTKGKAMNVDVTGISVHGDTLQNGTITTTGQGVLMGGLVTSGIMSMGSAGLPGGGDGDSTLNGNVDVVGTLSVGENVRVVGNIFAGGGINANSSVS